MRDVAVEHKDELRLERVETRKRDHELQVAKDLLKDRGIFLDFIQQKARDKAMECSDGSFMNFAPVAPVIG